MTKSVPGSSGTGLAAGASVLARRGLFEPIVEAVREPLLVLDAELRVLFANAAFYRLFRVEPREILGHPLYALGNRQWDIPRLRALLETIRRQDGQLEDFEVEHDFERIGRRTLRLAARRLRRGSRATDFIVLAIEDVTERARAEERLRVLADRLSACFAASPVIGYALAVRGEALVPVWVSENLEALLGYSRAEALVPGWWAEHVHPEDRARVLASVSKLLREGALRHEYRFLRKDGTTVWILDELRLVRGADGTAREAVGAWTDVTARKRLEEELRFATTVFERASEAIFVADRKWRILAVNPAFVAQTGYGAEEVLGRTPALLASGRHDAAFLRAIHRQLARTGVWRGELWNSRKSGEPYPAWTSIAAVRDSAGRVQRYVAIAQDLTERRAQELRIEQLAFYDALTGLPNRMLFLDRLAQALATARRTNQRLAVLFVDLNDFKDINDTRGHFYGDRVLAAAAHALQRVLRHGETLARYGGDEFVAVVSAAEGAALEPVLARLREALAQAVEVEGQRIPLAASIGIAIFPEDGASADELLRHADLAMYQAKSTRKGYEFYRAALGAEIAARAELARALARALEENRLELHFQPLVELAGGRLAGAEALLRWFEPERGGWVSPGEFVAVAEERGMIGTLGDWVFGAACRQLAAWRAAGYALPGRLSVNVSAQQLADLGLAERVRRIIERSGIEPQALELELTETALVRDPEGARVLIEQFKSCGIAIAIDDFGSGYSSFSYLRRFLADTLKIDMSFVRGMLRDPREASIVTAIVGMARSLGMRSCAEGVEHAEQAERLRAIGCDLAQGFFFGAPQPAEEFAWRWLAGGAGV
ncbi:MAG TPA: EAL domain-containing protein [Burkholderiales bacterium]|nr:EAL domain-containing protein [Burkholderiales bacterium]